MVSVEVWDGKNVFICGECGFKYPDKKFADECEKFCKEHGACNPKITAHAIAK